MIFLSFSSAPLYCFSSAAILASPPARRSSSVRVLPDMLRMSNRASVNCSRSWGVMEPIHWRSRSSLTFPMGERWPRCTKRGPSTFQDMGSCCMMERLLLSMTA